MIAPEQFPVPGSGSVEVCMLAIAKHLAAQHTVTIVSRRLAGLSAVSKRHNVTIMRVAVGQSRSYIAAVIAHIKDRHYDLIQVDNRPSFVTYVKQAFPKTPVVLFLHSLTFVPPKATIVHHLKHADAIIANSSSLHKHLNIRFASEKHKIKVVHLGVDHTRFRPLRHKKASPFTILFAGRLIPQKGIPVILKSVQLLQRNMKQVKLIIAGRGKQRKYVRRLKARAAQMRIPVRFVGMIPHQRIHRYYQTAHCFVCPSQKHESFGLVNVEALASGVPVVASNIGGIKEIVQHDHNGYLVNRYKDARQFAHYLLKIGRNPSTAQRLSRNARQTVLQHFTWAKTAQQVASIYKEMISK